MKMLFLAECKQKSFTHTMIFYSQTQMYKISGEFRGEKLKLNQERN